MSDGNSAAQLVEVAEEITPPAALIDTNNLANIRVSMFRGIDPVVTGESSLLDVAEDIRRGRWRERVEEVRSTYAEKDKGASNLIKKTLDGFTGAGTFSHRANENHLEPSRCMIMDIDLDLNQGLNAPVARDRIAGDPHCLFVFLSPTNGVKAVMSVDPARPYRESYFDNETYFKNTFDLNTDPECKDVSRLCFASYDPDLRIATGVVTPVPKRATPDTPVPAKQPDAHSKLTVDDVREPLRYIPARPHYNIWYRIIHSVKSVLPETDGIRLLKEWAPEETAGEYEEKWEESLDDITFGTLYFHAKNHGWVPSAAFILKVPPEAIREAERLHLLAKLEKCKYGVGPAPLKPIPRYLINGIPISTAGNITSISAQAKTGKTAVIGAMIAAKFVAECGGHFGCGGSAPDCFGITAGTAAGALIHIDSEQSRFDHYEGIGRALKRAHTEECPPWLHSHCMTGSTPREFCDAVRVLCKIEAAKAGIFAVIVDGVADLVSDVNEAGECNALVAELHAIAIQYDCSIVVVIHENPATTNGKSRGHLGSQLERKSETNLRLVRTEETTQMYADKCRGAPIPKRFGPCFAWDDGLGMHVTVSTEAAVQADKKTAELRELAEDCLSEGLPAGMSYVNLRAAIVSVRGGAAKSAERKITAMKRAGVIHQSGTSNLYYREPKT